MSDQGLLLITLILVLPLAIILVVQSAVDPLRYVIQSEDLDDRQVSTCQLNTIIIIMYALI